MRVNRFKSFVIHLNLTPKRKIKGRKNIVSVSKSSVFRKGTIDIKGDENKIMVSENSQFNNLTIYIRGNRNQIKIEKNVKFNRGGEIWIEDNDCEVIIGKLTTFENTHIAATESGSKIKIGADCMFAYDIDLRTGDSHSILDMKTQKRINPAKDIIIGDHVWIASHVSILKGSFILPNTIVATRSVVTKSFDKGNILIGGVPADILKESVTWDRRRL